MVVEGHGRFLIPADLSGGFAQGAQAGSGGADAGQDPKDPQNNHDPQAQTKLVLQPNSEAQEKQGGKDAGKSKLDHPQQKIQQFHTSSRWDRIRQSQQLQFIIPDIPPRFKANL